MWRPVTTLKTGRKREARRVENLKTNIRYCRNCGNEVSEKAIMCAAYGTPAMAGDKFCHNC